jgi:hypothetical protein
LRRTLVCGRFWPNFLLSAPPDTADGETLPPEYIHFVLAKGDGPMSGPTDDGGQGEDGKGENRRALEDAPKNPAGFDEDYKIGKNFPPRDKQWRPGQSGNPAGRPKNKRIEATDSDAILDKLLAEPRTAVKNGRTAKLPTNEIRLAVLVEQALRGNMPAHRILIEYLSRRRPTTSEDATPDYTAELRRRIEGMARRWEESQTRKKE